MIKYDGTARNSIWNFIQCLYGEDDMISEWIEDQNIEDLNIDDENFKKNFKLIDDNVKIN